jgi:hypothetical protein
MKLNEQQLTRLNRAFYEAELATMAAKDKIAEKDQVIAEIQKETNSTFQNWNSSTGETDYVESTAVEIIPPRKRRKS